MDTQARETGIMENTIQKYEAFVETVEQGSFTKAAHVLAYTQSGISRMIAELERSWGMRLLKRGRGGVELTSEGALVLPYVREICMRQRNLQMEIDSIAGLEAGVIRIGAFASVAAQWLPAMIKAFQADYPGIDYQLFIGDYSEIDRWIMEGRVDCGFTMFSKRATFEFKKIGSDRMFAVLPPTHPMAKRKRFPIKALDGEAFLMPEVGTDTYVYDLLRGAGVEPDIILSTPDDYVILSMVESGLGVSLMPELILERNPYDTISRPLDIPARREIGFAYKGEDEIPLVVRTFMRYVKRTPAGPEGGAKPKGRTS